MATRMVNYNPPWVKFDTQTQKYHIITTQKEGKAFLVDRFGEDKANAMIRQKATHRWLSELGFNQIDVDKDASIPTLEEAIKAFEKLDSTFVPTQKRKRYPLKDPTKEYVKIDNCNTQNDAIVFQHFEAPTIQKDVQLSEDAKDLLVKIRTIKHESPAIGALDDVVQFSSKSNVINPQPNAKAVVTSTPPMHDHVTEVRCTGYLLLNGASFEPILRNGKPIFSRYEGELRQYITQQIELQAKGLENDFTKAGVEGKYAIIRPVVQIETSTRPSSHIVEDKQLVYQFKNNNLRSLIL
jgi:hypothetical protein